jgi:Zn-dependent peptidase ImmA (M78 family)
MNWAEERDWLLAAVQRAVAQAGCAWPPAGPTPLRDLIAAFNLVHSEMHGLSYVQVAKALCKFVEPPADFWRKHIPLAGFVFANSHAGWIFVNQDDPIPRRRFSAAHELGHYLLHFAPESCNDEDGFMQDDPDMAEDNDHQAAIERQANRFAAELLMPEESCRRIVAKLQKSFGGDPTFLAPRLAGELLVSREAASWRLRSLGLA